MLTTAEVRWFYEGKIPAKLRSWYQHLPSRAEPQSPRIDQYLLESDTDALGIKFREGRVEVKQRQGEQRKVSFGPKLDGYVEVWRKWGFPLADARRAGKAFESFNNWIAVEKKRRVIVYGIGPKGRLATLSGGTACGCSVELTQIRVKKKLWWTLGFEAKGPSDDLEGTLVQVARAVFDASAPPRFGLANSCSYPSWLQSLSKTRTL